MDTQLKYMDFVRHNIYADHEMGLPKKWKINIDGGNFQHSAWYGCKIHYTDIDSPDKLKLLNDDNKNMLFDKGIPDPFSGILNKYKNMLEYMQEKIEKGYSYKGISIDKKISAIEPQVEKLWQNVFASANSPTVLNEKGQKIFDQSGIKDIILDNKEFLLDTIKKQNPRTAYDVQEIAQKVQWCIPPSLQFFNKDTLIIRVRQAIFIVR